MEQALHKIDVRHAMGGQMIWLVIIKAETTPAAADWQEVARGTAMVFCRAPDADAAALTARGQMLDLALIRRV